MTPRRKPNGAAPAPEVKRCAVYTRKSTSAGLEQEFNSLDAQRECCEQYIAARAGEGWQLVPERYDDGGFTGANIDRPAFQRILADAEGGRIDVVVVYKVDRLSRSLLDFAQVMDRFNRAGVAFVSVTQNFSTADAMGRLTLNMLMSFAEFEREMIAERTRDKIAAARRKGKWTGGSVPLGYQVQDKKLVVDDLEALIVREIFDLYEQHRSALAVARALDEAGRRTKRHRAQSGNLREARRWGKDAVLRVLKNPIYAGYMPYGDELHEGEHPALVDRERWRGLRAVLEGHRTANQDRPGNPEYILRGILRCARCGYAMTPASTRKGGKTYRYYRCVTRDKKGSDACQSKPLPADAIESFVIERIREATADGGLAADVARRLHARAARQREGLLTERAELPKKIAALAAETRKLVDTLAEVNGTALRLVEERIEQVNEQLALREARLAEVERVLAAVGEADLEIDWVADTLARFDAVWDALTDENRGRLARCLVERVEVDESSGQVTAVLADLGLGDQDDHQDTAQGRGQKPPARPSPRTPSMEARP